ncbi:MAG: DUF262 domain-containing protein [Armatimonadetes bacterium]|nr:DUF262 domain-containing protein [Armatimonadota bacterium]MDE2205481.1 DUF262 domain-containing protein [Armatimonadota bacterium]
MQARLCQFTSIINGITQFVIPVFQRDYRWTEANCEQLWKDVLQVAAGSGDHAHFLGSVVYVSTGDSSAGFTRWLMVDGQQRLTTLTLLLAALRDQILESQWTGGEDGPTANRIDAYFLKNLQEEGPRRHKLVLRRYDQKTLQAILDASPLPDTISERIRDNYEYFREQMAGTDPEVVYRGIGRLAVVDITLDRATDDPQLIFESLNSTGLDLSQSDLIRNFILMRLDDKEQTRLYESYWGKIESLFRGSERTFDAFMRDYIALKTQASRQERADEIYFAFRRLFGDLGTGHDELEHFLDELYRFARYHAMFSMGTGSPEKFREPLARLRRLVDVPATIVMRLLDCRDTYGTLSDEDFVRAVGLIESYIFRRSITGDQTRGYWQVFANLAYRIDNGQPLQSLMVGLARLRDNYSFPDDGEFRKALEERDIYGKRVCFELLDRLENLNTKEVTDTSKYSVEHIMPQNENLSAEWRTMLGNDWREVQRLWLHRLGNLTLTGYNSTYSDRPFSDKKTISGGFEESSVRLNKYVREQSCWTTAEMEHRGKLLAGQALVAWPNLVVDKSLISAADEAERRATAKRRDVGKVPMTPRARELFQLLSQRIRDIDGEIIELAEQKSVSYYHGAFFLELLPRKHGIVALLALDFNEVVDDAGIARDASQWKFFANAVHEGGVSVSINQESDVEDAMAIIRQAHSIASAGTV